MGEIPYVVKLTTNQDERGSLAWLEGRELPFTVRRLYLTESWLGDSPRGYHSHRSLYQLLLPVCGSVTVSTVSADGSCAEFLLERPSEALLIPPATWRVIRKRTRQARFLVLASQTFDEGDYVRDFNEFSAVWPVREVG
jgi:hypothetical protein